MMPVPFSIYLPGGDSGALFTSASKQVETVQGKSGRGRTEPIVGTVMTMQMFVEQVMAVVTQLPPDPQPAPPPGTVGNLANDILGWLKWAAGVAIIGCFFGGVAVFTAGRLFGNSRTGGAGTVMMVAAIGGVVVFSIGYGVLSALAGG